MYKEYKDRAAFLFVYIREAHPEDGWQSPANVKQGVVFNQPKTLTERRSVAHKCRAGLKLSMPCVVDTMENTADNLYAAWPERMFIIDSNGRIAYAGRQGPWGFKPQEVKSALKSILDAP